LKFCQALLLFILLTFSSKNSAAQDSVLWNRPLKFSTKQLIAPTLLFASGLALSGQVKYNFVDFRNEKLPNFYTKADDFLAFTPIVFAYGLDVIGVKSRNDFWNRSAILSKAELMMLATVYALKYSTKELRPDASDNRAFPSTHTAQAFLAATFLSVEYGQKIKWIPYAAYGVAGSVAAIRMANNRHFIGDVLVGAGIGILSQKFSYWTHQYRWGRHVPKPIVTF